MKNDQRLKYFLYARKSTENEDRQMASIDSQIQELTKIAEQKNIRIVEILSESKSAKAPGREIFNEMIQRINKGEAQGILCWKLNRLARNPIDGGQISWLIQQGIIKHIQTHSQSYYPTDNVIVMAVELGVANQFIMDLSTDTRRGLRTKAKRGWLPTYAPLGYMHNPFKRKGEKEIIKDPDRFELVRRMFDLMLTGKYTPPQIRHIALSKWKLTNRQGKEFSRSTIYRIFTSSFYYGEFEYPKNSGEWFKGKHEAIISIEEYDRIQLILGREGKPRPKNRVFAYVGLIKCGECGASITAETKIKKQKNGNIHQYTYYHCTKHRKQKCYQKGIEVKELEKQINEIISSFTIPPDFHEYLYGELKKHNKKEANDRNLIIASQHKAYTDCTKKLDRLLELRLNNELNEEEYITKKSDLLKEKSRINEVIENSDKRLNSWLETAEKHLGIAEYAYIRFNEGDIETKKEIFISLGSNFILKDQKLFLELLSFYSFLIPAKKEVDRIKRMLEPMKKSVNKEQLFNAYARNPIILRGWGSNPRPID